MTYPLLLQLLPCYSKNPDTPTIDADPHDSALGASKDDRQASNPANPLCGAANSPSNGKPILLFRATSTNARQSSSRVIVNCFAPWAVPCAQINTIIETLHQKAALPHETPITYATLQPEAVPSLLKKYNITTVPTVLFFSTTRLVRRITGADAAGIATSARWLATSADDVLLRSACELATGGLVVLAMKGEPDNPRCGFCKDAVGILREHGVVFDYVDIGADVGVREMLKKIYEWGTYPMLFARGRLVGGIDRLRLLADAGRLIEELAGSGVGEVERKDDITERLKKVVLEEEVMLFMKGTPDIPRCGFSRRIVEVLGGQGIQFGHFDVLSDNDVRQGLKKFSEWPTFPQLYSKGQFVGGLDVVSELVEAGELKKEMGLE